MINKVLEELGLTDSEIKVYKVLLKGKNAVGKIAQESEIHRRNVYDALTRLIKKAYVGYMVENGVKIYSITNPKLILEKLEQRKKNFEDLLPNLMNDYNNGTSKSETLFFRGKEGLKQIFQDQIEVGEEILVNATSQEVDKILKYFFPQYQLQRKINKIKTRMLFDKNYLNNETKKELKKLPFCKFKGIDDFNKSPMSQYIYGDNVALVVWSELPVAILIKNEDVAQGFRESFELMWKLSN